MDGVTPSKIDLAYTNELVIFRISNCCHDKDYTLSKLNKEEAKRLLLRLRTIEKLTWGQLAALTRDKGLTPEIPGTKSFEMIDTQDTSPSKIVERHYFHFRVGDDAFRVFGYQDKQYFYVTHLNPNGSLHHN